MIYGFKLGCVIFKKRGFPIGSLQTSPVVRLPGLIHRYPKVTDGLVMRSLLHRHRQALYFVSSPNVAAISVTLLLVMLLGLKLHPVKL